MPVNWKYIKRMLEVQNYRLCNSFNFTARIEVLYQRKILSWYNNKFISKTTYNLIRPIGSRRPKLYGLSKIHKILSFLYYAMYIIPRTQKFLLVFSKADRK